MEKKEKVYSKEFKEKIFKKGDPSVAEKGRIGGKISGERKREMKRQKELINYILNETMKNGKTKYQNILERVVFNMLKPDAKDIDILKGVEYVAKINGELVDKVAQTDTEGNDIKREIVSNKDLLDIIKKRNK